VIDRVLVRRDTYYESIALMAASRDLSGLDGVVEAAIVAATPLNQALVRRQGFDVPDDVVVDDLLVAVRAESPAAADRAVEALERLLARPRAAAACEGDRVPPSIAAAARLDVGLSLAMVSVPGDHAAYEVATALEHGLDVFCFSSGVDVATERALKTFAARQGRIVMGPDCGTAIIDDIGLGFANVVRPGPVGIVGASGTGIQEIVSLLDQAGLGISHAIGVGGRDLGAEVGGISTLRALELLAADQRTELQIVVSKRPDPGVVAEVATAAAATGRPTVLAALGVDEPPPTRRDVIAVGSLADAVAAICRLAGAPAPIGWPDAPPVVTPGDIRGLFCGGSLCLEAMSVVSRHVGRVASNVALRPGWRLPDVWTSEGHTFVDFGDAELTVGRPHPMIDPSLRNERFVREASDPHVGVVVLDVVLGRGAHPDPAGDLAPIIRRSLARRRGALSVVVAVCGTDGDPQQVHDQVRRLRDAGALSTRMTAHAATLALVAGGVVS
jgi:FdrA protein